MADWGFLTNHARALLYIAHDPDARLRDLAVSLNITERTAYSVVVDLTEAAEAMLLEDRRRREAWLVEHLASTASTE